MIDDILEQLISQLPESPTLLDKANTKKIHEYIPVPTDHKIRWADISSFGGYPAGIVITDRGLIVKATRDEVKHNNELAKKQKKQSGSKEKANTVKVIYQIIPWEYYSPEDYEVVAFDAGKGKTRYTLKAGKTELAQFESAALFQLFRKYKKLAIERRELAEATVENSTFSAINTVNVEGVMFNAAYGADQTKTGHGIYAEEAGTILDRLAGEQATVVGRDNAKNGPDKIVDASPIQCKYCKTAYSSVNSCFKNDPTTGTKTFRYYDLSGNAMKFEEGFNVGSLQLHLLKLGHDRFQALLCSIESVRQTVIAFLVFRLVEGDVGVFVDALLYHIRNQLRFFQQAGLFRFQLRSVKEQVHHLVDVRNDLVLGGQQLVCRRQEGILDVLIRQVRRGAMLVVIKFVIALPDGLAIFAVGMPDL